MVLNVSIRDFGRDDILTGVRDDRKLHILVSINDRLDDGRGDDQGWALTPYVKTSFDPLWQDDSTTAPGRLHE